jgi:hypothetical protein
MLTNFLKNEGESNKLLEKKVVGKERDWEGKCVCGVGVREDGSMKNWDQRGYLKVSGRKALSMGLGLFFFLSRMF